MTIFKKRLSINMETATWLKTYLYKSRTQICPVTPEIAAKSCNLTGFLGDPADRLIVATAIEHHFQMVTRDDKILKFCKAQHIPFLKI